MTDEHEHEREHGGAREPGHDAQHWDERYAASDRLWSGDPNPTVAQIVGPMAPGRALDLGAGEGRHAVWLARSGWQVTAVDFSAIGLGRGRSAPGGEAVDWIVADVREWRPPPATAYDLILVAFLHLADDVFGRLAEWLAPGGAVVVIGHALRNLTDGVGGPQDPAILNTPEQLREKARGLQVLRCEEVERTAADGATAIDVVLVARRPT